MNHSDIYNTLFRIAETVERTANAQLVSGIYKRGKLISFGMNSKKSHPFQKRFGTNCEAIYLHSEVDAIKNALRHISLEELKKCSIFVMRVKKDKPGGKYISGTSKPCAGCSKAIATFGIKEIYFTENDKNEFICQ